MSDSGDDIGDSFTETTHTFWFSRILASIKGVLVGLALIVCSGIGLFWNEGRSVQTAKSLAEGAGLVVSAPPEKVEPTREGQLVHVTGPVTVGTPPSDSEFRVSAPGVRLVRTVEMYQWKEDRRTETRKLLGGGEETVTVYTYAREWSERRNDSSRFNRPSGHTNPPMRFASRSIYSTDATLGAFKLDAQVLSQISADQDVPLDPALAGQLRERITGPVRVADGMIFLGDNARSPDIGDHRIRYKAARPETISVIGRQTAAAFAPYQTQAGDQLLMATGGTVPADAMFKSAERDNRILTWILRAVGVIFMFVGWTLILRPLVVVADVVPFIGSILGAGAALVSAVLTLVLAPAIIALAWLWYRPLFALAVLAAGVAAAFGVRTLAARKAAARPAPA